jgi:hypothetical protein
MMQVKLETPLNKALVKENGYSQECDPTLLTTLQPNRATVQMNSAA